MSSHFTHSKWFLLFILAVILIMFAACYDCVIVMGIIIFIELSVTKMPGSHSASTLITVVLLLLLQNSLWIRIFIGIGHIFIELLLDIVNVLWKFRVSSAVSFFILVNWRLIFIFSVIISSCCIRVHFIPKISSCTRLSLMSQSVINTIDLGNLRSFKSRFRNIFFLLCLSASDSAFFKSNQIFFQFFHIKLYLIPTFLLLLVGLIIFNWLLVL